MELTMSRQLPFVLNFTPFHDALQSYNARNNGRSKERNYRTHKQEIASCGEAVKTTEARKMVQP